MRRGVPQGSVLGPLLFILFINDLPLQITDPKLSCDLFADDATLHTPDTDINAINNRLQSGLIQVSKWCQCNAMILNPRKTESMVATSRQKHQIEPLTLNLSLSNQPITQVAEHKLLGVTVDNELEWEPHINNICKKISQNLFLLSKLRPYVDTNTRLLFYNAHIKSHIDYVSTVWDGSKYDHMKRLNSLHRRAAKVILPDPTLTTDQKLQRLNILPLKKHLLFNKGIMVFRIKHAKLPKYLCDLFSKQNSRYSKRHSHFITPRPRILSL